MAEAPHPRFASAIPEAIGLDVPCKAICAKNRSGLVLSTPPSITPQAMARFAYFAPMGCRKSPRCRRLSKDTKP